MGQSRSAVVRRLSQARQSRLPVVIRATDQRTRDSLGFVVAVAGEWLVLHALDEGFFLDDLVLLRLEDIKRVKPHPHPEFVTRVIAALGVPVEEFECSSEARTTELLQAVAERAGLVCIYYLARHGHRWREVGSIRAVGRKRIELHGIGDDGAWFEDSGLRRVKHIRRVEFGGRYLGVFERCVHALPDPSPGAIERMANLNGPDSE